MCLFCLQNMYAQLLPLALLAPPIPGMGVGMGGFFQLGMSGMGMPPMPAYGMPPMVAIDGIEELNMGHNSSIIHGFLTLVFEWKD